MPSSPSSHRSRPLNIVEKIQRRSGKRKRSTSPPTTINVNVNVSTATNTATKTNKRSNDITKIRVSPFVVTPLPSLPISAAAAIDPQPNVPSTRRNSHADSKRRKSKRSAAHRFQIHRRMESKHHTHNDRAEFQQRLLLLGRRYAARENPKPLSKPSQSPLRLMAILVGTAVGLSILPTIPRRTKQSEFHKLQAKYTLVKSLFQRYQCAMEDRTSKLQQQLLIFQQKEKACANTPTDGAVEVQQSEHLQHSSEDQNSVSLFSAGSPVVAVLEDQFRSHDNNKPTILKATEFLKKQGKLPKPSSSCFQPTACAPRPRTLYKRPPVPNGHPVLQVAPWISAFQKSAPSTMTSPPRKMSAPVYTTPELLRTSRHLVTDEKPKHGENKSPNRLNAEKVILFAKTPPQSPLVCDLTESAVQEPVAMIQKAMSSNTALSDDDSIASIMATPIVKKKKKKKHSKRRQSKLDKKAFQIQSPQVLPPSYDLTMTPEPAKSAVPISSAKILKCPPLNQAAKPPPPTLQSKLAAAKKPMPRGQGWISNETARAFVSPIQNSLSTAAALNTAKGLFPRSNPGRFKHTSIEPTQKRQGEPYNEVVRNKAERKTLPAYECPECAGFYRAVLAGKGGSVFDMEKDFKGHCRHRSRFEPSSTPEDFWELSFADEREARKLK